VADGCVVTEIVGGEKTPIASDCTTPERRAVLDRLLERVSGGGLSELGAVAELRKTLFIPDVDSELKRIRADQDSDLFILEALAASSFASVPLVARDVTVGALSLFTFGPRRLDPADLTIIESLGRILALALKNDTHLTAAEAASVHAKLVAERLQAALASMDDAVAIFDLHDTLVLCNDPYRRLEASFEATQIEESSQSLRDTLAHFAEFESLAEAEKFSADRQAAVYAARDVFDVRVRDGRSLRVMNRQTQAGRVVTVWDLTDDARRETELREARLAAEAASHAKSEFLSSMSHELRTPLNAILGFAQLLGRDRIEPLSARHKSRVDQILKGGEHLLRLIDDILDLVRIEAGGISISPEPLDVVAVLSEVLASLEPQATRAGVKLELGDVDEEHLEIRADRTRYSQILLNFGSNAIKYNRRGGHATFHVRSSAPGRVRVSVVDDGVGIPYDRQASLFQPFQRAGQETGPIEGTGIGLVITRRLARLMEGHVGFTSTPGEGSEFWIDMPLWEAEGERSAVTQKLERPQSTFPPGVSRLVLYIEDNPANVDFMVDVFDTLEGFELVTARTAGEGINVAEARHPAAVLMDINLPDMSGFEAKEILSSLPGMQRVPVIALSAAATERDRQRGSHAGFFRYLTKPVEIGELESALSAALTS
ncbi:MAG TPA: ATP-binding protein, partial [Polyangiaceae bacterium]|nr:ATP-binding protein [Polyangiaceae bacterium]